jgi:hypothetical protein
MFLNKSKLGLSVIALLISASAFANDTVPAEVYAQPTVLWAVLRIHKTSALF